MITLPEAIAEFLRLQAIELALPASNEDEEHAVWQATCRTDEALAVALAIPADSGVQAAAKLAAVASHYDLCAGGVDRQSFGMIVAECVRFLGAAHLATDARATA